MRLRPLRDYVWIRPRPELAEATTTLKLTHGEMSEAEQAIVARANTVGFVPLHHLAAVSADYKSAPDSLTFGEVLAVGKGNPAIAADRPGVEPGDLVSYQRNRIARELPDDEHPGKWLYLVHEHGIAFRHPDGPGGMPEPLGDRVLTRVDPDGARKALGLTLPLTDEELAWGITTRTHQRTGADVCPACKQRTGSSGLPGSVVGSRDRMMVERVVAAGRGRWVTAIWDEKEFGVRHRRTWLGTDVSEGEMVGFSSANERARFRLHGEVFTVSAWQDFICAFPEAEEQAAE